jgi:Holliday junction resolvasome RuvABC endonuclease subunit
MNLNLRNTINVLGIDPGNVNIGVCVMQFTKECTSQRIILKKTYDATDPDTLRNIASMSIRHDVMAVSIEDAFIGPNKASAAKLLILIGQIEQMFRDYPVVRPTATRGNSILGLHARKGKKITDKMKKEAATSMFGEEFKTPHEASAAAIAIAGLESLQDEILRFGSVPIKE